MDKNQGQTIMEIMNSIKGVKLREKYGGHFKFRMYVTRSMCDTSIEVLDLGVRSYNCLKRAGFSTVGDLVDAISGGVELKSIRNCGKTSVREIMEHLFLYQYNSLPADKQQSYLMEVIEMNR